MQQIKITKLSMKKQEEKEREKERGKKLLFAGQPLFIGMDVHKKSWTLCILSAQYELTRITIESKVDVLVKYLRRNYPGAEIHLVYEAGFCGYWISRELKQRGIKSIIANPADVPTTDKERKNKRDKVDAGKLARSLRNGELRGIYEPSETLLEDRSLVRTRSGIVKKQTRVKTQIKSQLNFYGIETPEDIVDKYWSRRYISYLESLEFNSTSGKFGFQFLVNELLEHRARLLAITREIRKLSITERYELLINLLRTIPGIGLISGMIILTELFDISRFGGLDKLISYLGLLPTEDSSGEKESKGKITPRKNKALRRLIIEISWIAVRKDPVLLAKFNNDLKRMNKNQAIIKVAKRLVNRIRFVLLNKKPYEILHLES